MASVTAGCPTPVDNDDSVATSGRTEEKEAEAKQDVVVVEVDSRPVVVVGQALSECGLNNVDPCVAEMLARLAANHAHGLLDRLVHFGRTVKGVEPNVLTVDDVLFLNALKATKSGSRIDDEDWSHLAEERNSVALSFQGNKKAVALPPERHCLLMPNYRLVKNVANVDRRQSVGQKNSKRLNLSSGFSILRPGVRDIRKRQFTFPVSRMEMVGSDSGSPLASGSRYSVIPTTASGSSSGSTGQLDKRAKMVSMFRMGINPDSKTTSVPTSTSTIPNQTHSVGPKQWWQQS